MSSTSAPSCRTDTQAFTGGGLVGRVALTVALLPAAFLTVLFEPTWWFAAGILLAGGAGSARRRAPDPYRAMAGPGV